MTQTTIDASTISPISHREAMCLQARELECTLRLLRSLDDSSWDSSTDCPEWDIRAMYQHVLGACEAGASVRENVHQLRLARAYRRRHGGPLEAALSGLQVRERADLSAVEIMERLDAISPRTVRGRTRTPALVRNHVKMAVDGPVYERWKLGYLIDIIYLRDLWMHRIDACVATGRSLEPETSHDGRIVADVVAEWARRHARPFVLELTGPAGGFYTQVPDDPEVERLSLDAVEFCRILAGRGPATGLLTTVVPF